MTPAGGQALSSRPSSGRRFAVAPALDHIAVGPALDQNGHFAREHAGGAMKRDHEFILESRFMDPKRCLIAR